MGRLHFRSEIGSGFGEPGGTPPRQELPGVPPGVQYSCTKKHLLHSVIYLKQAPAIAFGWCSVIFYPNTYIHYFKMLFDLLYYLV